MPKTKEQLRKLAADFAKRKDLKSAFQVCDELTNSYPDYAEGWFSAYQVSQLLADKEKPLLYIDRAISLDPYNYRWLIEKAFYMLGLHRMSEVKSIANDLLSKDLEGIPLKNAAGRLFALLDMHDESKKQYQAALKIEPEHGVLYYNLATAQRFLGELEAAEINLDKAIVLDSSDFEAQDARSNLRRQTPECNHTEELQSLLSSGDFPPAGEVQLSFALAKEFEDLKNYKQSFTALTRGASVRRKHINYDVQPDLDIIGRIQSIYSAEIFNRNIKGTQQQDSIFILGMPRTGTTLVERILESHSSVKSAGELNNFAIEMMRLVKSSGLSPTSRLDLIDKTTQLNFKQLGEAYIKSVEPLRDGSPRFIDKLPFNYLYAGLIHLAMPNAKIINLQRHPMDTCYSVFKQLFKDAYPFSYDLKELGHYYVAYRQLMDHWNKVMPGVIHTVNYEDVVADTEGEVRKLLEYCDLPWEDKCLRFYENKSASTTASATQVRQKVYSSSVGKCRNYEKQLQPLADILTAAGIDIS